MPGNEQRLIDLAVNYQVGEAILDIVDEYRQDVFRMTGQSIADVNPTPGNKAHGITTLCEKAIGNLKLSGSRTKVQGVLQVGEDIPGPGQWFLDNRQGGERRLRLYSPGHVRRTHLPVYHRAGYSPGQRSFRHCKNHRKPRYLCPPGGGNDRL